MSPDLDQLMTAARSADPVERGDAATELGGCADRRALEPLGALLTDPDEVVRFKASVALAHHGDDRGLSPLLWGLRKDVLCFTALQALCDLASPRALPAVRKFFGRWFLHPLERMQAAAVLHRSGDAAGTRYLEAHLTSVRPEERGFALELWGRLQMPGAFEVLRAVLQNAGDFHRLDAVRGLMELGDARAIPILEPLGGQGEDPELGEVARAALAALRARQP